MGQFGQPRVFGWVCTRPHYRCPRRGVTRLPHVPAPRSPPARADRATASPWGAGGADKGLLLAGMGCAGNPAVGGVDPSFLLSHALSSRAGDRQQWARGRSAAGQPSPDLLPLPLHVLLFLGEGALETCWGNGAAGGSPSGSWHCRGLWGPCPSLRGVVGSMSLPGGL